MERSYLRTRSGRSVTRQIAEELPSAGIRPVFYVTPIDVEFCSRYVPEFVEDLAKKDSIVVDVLTVRGQSVIDLSNPVAEESFYWSYDPAFLHYPNEHINQQEKFLVAQRLADRILKHE